MFKRVADLTREAAELGGVLRQAVLPLLGAVEVEGASASVEKPRHEARQELRHDSTTTTTTARGKHADPGGGAASQYLREKLRDASARKGVRGSLNGLHSEGKRKAHAVRRPPWNDDTQASRAASEVAGNALTRAAVRRAKQHLQERLEHRPLRQASSSKPDTAGAHQAMPSEKARPAVADVLEGLRARGAQLSSHNRAQHHRMWAVADRTVHRASAQINVGSASMLSEHGMQSTMEAGEAGAEWDVHRDEGAEERSRWLRNFVEQDRASAGSCQSVSCASRSQHSANSTNLTCLGICTEWQWFFSKRVADLGGAGLRRWWLEMGARVQERQTRLDPASSVGDKVDDTCESSGKSPGLKEAEQHSWRDLSCHHSCGGKWAGPTT